MEPLIVSNEAGTKFSAMEPGARTSSPSAPLAPHLFKIVCDLGIWFACYFRHIFVVQYTDSLMTADGRSVTQLRMLRSEAPLFNETYENMFLHNFKQKLNTKKALVSSKDAKQLFAAVMAKAPVSGASGIPALWASKFTYPADLEQWHYDRTEERPTFATCTFSLPTNLTVLEWS